MTITVPDLTPAETKGLKRATDLYNDEVARSTPAGTTPVVVTPAQYLRQRVLEVIASYAVQDVDAERTALAAAYRNATDEQRQAARSSLGLS